MKKKIFIHPSSYVEKDVRIGQGTKVWYFCHIRKKVVIGKNCQLGQNVYIDPYVRIGNNVKIGNNVSVYRGVSLEDGVFCGPSVVFTNVINPRSYYPRKLKEYKTTLVKKGATIGANATVICGNTIGEFSFIGAGSVITKDVLPYALVYGNPAKQNGWICECGEKLEFKRNRTKCKICKKGYLLKNGKVKRVI